ncbi:hypothetical protein B0A48_09443 [Cryoendolithus antarcticus]|uniref:Pre-rRNA-processing protein RIX1 n=1 Tax=Cryoendolithus antarcticus TaxID=1507870 RepID=A0A1V8SZS5_9PEZI|nr:hypothetical protein B0A48_09443 [Cryoendolithus antarcticus]
MSRKSSPQAVATLKQISYRIASTPVERLPQIIPNLAGLLWNCRDLLGATSASTKRGSDDGMLIYRLNVQLTTLLQDRTVQGRWSAVVLTKAIIEAGGLETLSKSNGWVKSLLGILKKSDPPTTRCLTVIALTRIFTLTWDHSNLIREITTPALPTFISTCLSNVERKTCSWNEVQTILEAFAVLVPRHPATFRTFEGQICNLCKRIVSNDEHGARSMYYSEVHRNAARSLLVALHCCAPKQGAFEKWDETFKATTIAAHATCDRVFRAVVEGWKSTSGMQPSLSAQNVAVGECQSVDEDAAGLSRWSGNFAGGQRLITLVDLVSSHITSSTAGPGPVRLGILLDLVTRICGVIVPTPGRQDFTKPNPQISKDERDALYTLLPGVHVAVLQLIMVILDRFGTAITSVIPRLLDQSLWVFRAEKGDDSIRAATYALVADILALIGPTLDKDQVAELTQVVMSCCSDLLPEDAPRPVVVNGLSIGGGATKRSSSGSARPAHTNSTATYHELERAAARLLAVLLAKLNTRYMSRKLRAQLDRTAILTKNKDGLIASILNPPLNAAATGLQSSLLPFLAKLFPSCPEVEAILRPRMPVLLTGRKDSEDGEGEDDEEQEEDDDDVEVEDADEHEDEVDEVTEVRSEIAEVGQASTDPDLLSALDDQLDSTSGQEHSKDLYNATPPTTTINASASGFATKTVPPNGAAKRTTPHSGALDHASEQSSKRQRMTLDPEPASTAPSTTSIQEPPAVFGAALAAAAAKALSDDGSDFELPPLTMEMDTDSEDEGDEEDEDVAPV